MTPFDRAIADAHTRTLVSYDSAAELVVRIFDGQSLDVLERVAFTDFWPQTTLGGAAPVFTFDPASRLLSIIAYRSSAERQVRLNPRLVTLRIGETSPRITLVRAIPISAFPPGANIAGMALSPDGTFYMVGQIAPPVPVVDARAFGALVAEVDPENGNATGRWEGAQALNACQVPISGNSQAAVALWKGRLIVGCATGRVPFTEIPGTPVVVSIDLDDPSRQDVYLLPGNYAVGESYFDPAGGRLLLVGMGAGKPGQAVWVFDTTHRVFVGAVKVGDLNLFGAGVNPANGRLYVGVEGSLLVTSDRGLELAQATQIDEVKPLFGPIMTIPFNRRLIVPRQAAKGGYVYDVYEDLLPDDLFEPGRPVDHESLDETRTDTPQYVGAAQGFGVRVHQLGGVNGALQNLRSQRGVNYWTEIGNATGLQDGDRDVHLARVSRASLTAGESSGGAISGDADDRTRTDHRTVSGESWPFELAECSDFSGDRATGSREGAKAECDIGAARTVVTAGNDGVVVPGVMAVGASLSEAVLRMDPKRGLVAELHAEARNVTLGSAVRIGEISSDVTVAALGRPGAASASYVRRLHHVTAGPYSCETECPEAETIAAITKALGGQFRVELPAHDVGTTAGGANARVLREPWEHQQDVAVNNQSVTELQVPALRVSYVGDRSASSRLIVDFAATSASVTHFPVGGGPAGEGSFEEGESVVAPVDAGPVVTGPAREPRRVEPPAGVLERTVRRITRAWRLALESAVGSILLRAIAIGFFGVPLYAAVRRRHLMAVARDSR